MFKLTCAPHTHNILPVLDIPSLDIPPVLDEHLHLAKPENSVRVISLADETGHMNYINMIDSTVLYVIRNSYYVDDIHMTYEGKLM